MRGIDWTAIFKSHPELTPPGYADTVRNIRSERKS